MLLPTLLLWRLVVRRRRRRWLNRAQPVRLWPEHLPGMCLCRSRSLRQAGPPADEIRRLLQLPTDWAVVQRAVTPPLLGAAPLREQTVLLRQQLGSQAESGWTCHGLRHHQSQTQHPAPLLTLLMSRLGLLNQSAALGLDIGIHTSSVLMRSGPALVRPCTRWNSNAGLHCGRCQQHL